MFLCTAGSHTWGYVVTSHTQHSAVLSSSPSVGHDSQLDNMNLQLLAFTAEFNRYTHVAITAIYISRAVYPSVCVCLVTFVHYWWVRHYKYNIKETKPILISYPLLRQLLSSDTNYSFPSQHTVHYKTWGIEQREARAEGESAACISNLCK
jgi:hypothetical protein